MTHTEGWVAAAQAHGVGIDANNFVVGKFGLECNSLLIVAKSPENDCTPSVTGTPNLHSKMTSLAAVALLELCFLRGVR